MSQARQLLANERLKMVKKEQQRLKAVAVPRNETKCINLPPTLAKLICLLSALLLLHSDSPCSANNISTL